MSMCSCCLLLIDREIQTRPVYECRCDERLKTKAEESMRLTYTGLLVEILEVIGARQKPSLSKSSKFISRQKKAKAEPHTFVSLRWTIVVVYLQQNKKKARAEGKKCDKPPFFFWNSYISEKLPFLFCIFRSPRVLQRRPGPCLLEAH